MLTTKINNYNRNLYLIKSKIPERLLKITKRKLQKLVTNRFFTRNLLNNSTGNNAISNKNNNNNYAMYNNAILTA